MPTFEFNNQLMPQSIIDIDDLGNFAIEGTNDEGYCWYLIVRSSLGVTTFASCGPVIPEIQLLPSGFTQSIERQTAKQDKLEKTINLWLNDRAKKLTGAEIIEIDDAIDQFRDLQDYLRNYSEELN